MIRTWSGVLVDFLDPRPEDVRLRDVACALSRVCRYGGHLSCHYSVAQHAVLVSRYCDPADALAGLHHDDTEYLMGDVPSPLKRTVYLSGYRELEGQVWRQAIAPRFGLPLETPASVTLADQRVYMAEVRDLRGGETVGAYDVEPIEERIVPLRAEDAAELYVLRHSWLMAGRGE